MSIETDFESQHISAMLKRIQKIDAIYNYASKEIADRLVRNTLKYGQQGTSFFRWNRKTEEQIDVILESLRNGVYENIRNGSADAWDIANAKNDMLVKSYLGNMTVSGEIYAIMHQLNLTALDAFLNRIVNGLTIFDRVWDLVKVGKNQMELALSAGIAEGRSAAVLARDIKQSLNEPDKLFRRVRDKDGNLVLSKAAQRYHPGRGVYRSSFKNAMRLTRTEINGAYRQSDYDRRQQLSFVVGIEVHLSAQHPAYDICDSMQGRYPKSFIWTAWHPQCICYTTSVLASKEEFKKYLRTGQLDTKRTITTIPKKAEQYMQQNGDKLRSYNTQFEWMGNFTQENKLRVNVSTLKMPKNTKED